MHRILNLTFSAIFLLTFFSVSCKKEAIPTRTEAVLGTICSVNAYEDASEDLYNELFDRLHKIENRFSPNIAESDISRVNMAAGEKSVAVHEDVFYVLQAAVRFAELSNGSFDPTIGPLVKLWGINTSNPKVPNEKEIEEAKALVNYKNLELIRGKDGNSSRVLLKKSGMALDLGGIAKGYAADELARILGEHKVKKAIINLGGNILAYGSKEDADWEIGIKNPMNLEGGVALSVSFKADNSVVTSGLYERYFIEEGILYHHILDPRSGKPARSGVLSSTIISPSSMQADALSTIAFLLGADAYMELNAAPAVFINSDTSIIASSSLRGHLKPQADEFSKIEFK